MKKDIVVYQAKNGAIELREDLRAETVWASLDQISGVFGCDKSIVSRHIKNILITSHKSCTDLLNSAQQVLMARQYKQMACL